MQTVLANLSPYERGSHWHSVLMTEAWGDHDPLTPIYLDGSAAGFVGSKFGVYPTAHVRLSSLDPLEHRLVDLVPFVGTIEAAAAGGPSVFTPAPHMDVDRSGVALSTTVLRLSNGRAGAVTLEPQFPVAPESGVWGFSERLGALVVEAWWQMLPTSRIVPFELLVNNSLPGRPVNSEPLSLKLELPAGIRPIIDHEQQKGFWTEYRDGAWWVHLVEGSAGDRQSIHVRGRLHLLDYNDADSIATLEADRWAPAVGLCLAWEEEWGPWHATPAKGRETNAAQQLELANADYQRAISRVGGVWDVGVRAKQARKTGHDHDYGLSKGANVFNAGKYGPANLYALGAAATAEASRPQQVYEANGLPVMVEDHPKLQSLGLGPHYRLNHSEQLGNPNSKGEHGWEKMSFSHASNNGLAVHTLLTMSYAGRRLFEHQAMWIRANKSAGWGETRAYGRIPQTAAYCYLATGDERIVDYFEKRWDHEFDEYLSRHETVGKVVPFGHWTKIRSDWPLWPLESWIPWQTAMALYGLDGMHEVYKRVRGKSHPKAHLTIKLLCELVVGHGWYELGEETERGAVAVFDHDWGLVEDAEQIERWPEKLASVVQGPVSESSTRRFVLGYQIARRPDDRPLTNEEYQNPKLAAPHFGTKVDWWSLASAYVARREDVRRKKAQRIIDQYEAVHAALPFAYDLESEWRAIR